MATFVVCHGAWSAGWAWRKMRPLMKDAGHTLITPTSTGLGERGHLATPAVDLELHIRDVTAVLEFEDLTDVVLIGLSYGGRVATGVVYRARARIAQLIYLDAFVPQDGQSLFDLQSDANATRMRDAARSYGQGWRIPPNPTPPDTQPADVAWIAPRRLPQPIGTFEQVLRLRSAKPVAPRSYIYCRRVAPGDVFRQFAAQAQRDASWRHFEIDASHSPHITAPQALMATLEQILAAGSPD